MNQEAESQTSAERDKRRTKWIRPDLQAKVIFSSLTVGATVLFLNWLFFYFGLWNFKSPPSESAMEVVHRVRLLLAENMLLAMAAAVPLSVLFGIFFSFRFCGPIHRFLIYLKSVKEGQWARDCGLRERDNLVDLNDAINGAIAEMRGHIRAQHELLGEFQAVVESNVEDFSDRERVEKLLATAAENMTVTATRLGESNESDEPWAEQARKAEPEIVTSS